MRFVSAGTSVRGPSHVDEDLPNQDAVALRGSRGGWVAAVCDGLGSCQLSDIGSRAASGAVLEVLTARPRLEPAAANAAIHARWIERVSPRPMEAVATTCLWASVDSEGRGQASQLGDGLILFRSAGRFYRLTPERQGYSNQTQALWKEHNGDFWHQSNFQLTHPGDGVILMTDGVSDDLVPDALAGFFDVVCQHITLLGRRRGRRWLTRELEGWSTPCHGDDKSVVAIFRIES